MEQSMLASKFDGRISVPSNLDFVTNISPDGEAVTIIFSNLVLSVEPLQPAIGTKVLTLHLPYATDQASVTITMDLHGAILAEAGRDVRLIACAGDTTKVVDLLAHAEQAIALRGTSRDARRNPTCSPTARMARSRTPSSVFCSGASRLSLLVIVLIDNRS